jgi:hypothetical protein
MFVVAVAALSLHVMPVVGSEEAVKALPLMKQARLMWERKPDTFLMTKYFPKAAKAAGVDKAKVELACTADGFGSLDCTAISESVEGLGFGEAAVKVIEHGKVAATDRKSPEGRSFRFTVKFGTWAKGEDAIPVRRPHAQAANGS